MTKVFIDGKAGTTGLRIYERLGERDDIELITLSEEDRKNKEARRWALNSCDVAFLCLPDDAAREALSLVENPDVTLIDTSTAHRTEAFFAYGFPELSDSHREKILSSKRIAVPGCHACGFIALVYPLVANGFLHPDTLLTCHSVTGYSGGGKKMIADYESPDREEALASPRQYGLTQEHKHLKEMKAITGISSYPAFSPIVSDFYSGMVMTVPIFKSMLSDNKDINALKELYMSVYNKGVVSYSHTLSDDGFVSANALSGRDGMEISVLGNSDRILLVARYDNLGKGASGAAIQCFNLAIGCEETKGLVL